MSDSLVRVSDGSSIQWHNLNLVLILTEGFHVGRLDYHGLTIRKRPHYQPLGGTLFVTFRLADSIPKSAVRYYKAKRGWLRDQLRRVERISAEAKLAEHASWLTQLEQLNREWFLRCEDILHREAIGPTWMRDARIADKVAENLRLLDCDAYRLDAFSVMSNHVHTVFRPLVSGELMEEILRSWDDSLARIPALSRIMQTIKGRSARECNLILGRSGSFWEHESFDHVIRKGKFDKTIRYVFEQSSKNRCGSELGRLSMELLPHGIDREIPDDTARVATFKRREARQLNVRYASACRQDCQTLNVSLNG
ncbi:MAG: transposase [Pyrinomonadaceae bacterium]